MPLLFDASAPAILLLDRRHEPLLDQMQHVPVADASSHRCHQFGVRNAVEVAGEIRIYDLSMSRVDQALDMPYGVQCAAALPIGVLLRLQVGLEDRRSTNTAAVWTTRSRTVDIPNGRFLPSGLGM